MAAYSSKEEVDNAYDALGETFRSGLTKKLAWRRWQLKQFWWMMDDNEEAFKDALHADLHRPPTESLLSDIRHVKADILEHLEKLDEWTAPTKVDSGAVASRVVNAYTRQEPLGVALIIGAWNFPVMLLLQPLVAAIAAGNCVLLKPSEVSPAVEALVYKLVPSYMDPRAIRAVTGGAAETGYILEHKFDHIFFTGSGKIARIIAAAAAKHLTPTVLELGGQGPCIVDKSADVDLAARKIAFVKFLNAGQICVSVNHVFAHPDIADSLVDRLAYWNGQYLSEGGDGQMSRIINERNFDRLAGLVDASEGKVVIGGNERDRASLFFPTTVVRDVTLSDSLMSEELFGPILPIITATPEEAVAQINTLPAPLAMALFSQDRQVVQRILDGTNSGGVTVNNVLVHAFLPGAPFGGVGESGHGAYHGRYGIDCFSHRRTVAEVPQWLEKLSPPARPPYDAERDTNKLAVKNRLGFKRGETMEQQREERRTQAGVGGSDSVVLLGAAGVAILAAMRFYGRI